MFPMTREQCALARYRADLPANELVYCFVPNHWLFGDKDICVIDGGEPCGVLLKNYNDDFLMQIDTLYIDYDSRIENAKLYTKIIDMAKHMGTEVVLSKTLMRALNFDIKNVSKPHMLATSMLYEIKCPVITVLTQGSHTNQFAVELALRRYFTKSGYRVSQIGSNDASLFFGFSGTPDYLHGNSNTQDKIISFNHHMKSLVEHEDAELLIIGIPDAIMKYNNQFLQGLGILPYIMCTSVRSDFSVLCMYHMLYTMEYLDEMRRHCHYHLAAPVSMFEVSNTGLLADEMSFYFSMKYVNLDTSFVLDSFKDLDVNGSQYLLFNALNKMSIENACVQASESLTSNVQYMN